MIGRLDYKSGNKLWAGKWDFEMKLIEWRWIVTKPKTAFVKPAERQNESRLRIEIGLYNKIDYDINVPQESLKESLKLPKKNST